MSSGIPFVQRDIVIQNCGLTAFTVLSPYANWMSDQLRRIQYDLHAVQSAIITVGESFLLIERDMSAAELSFFVQCYRCHELDKVSSEPEIDVVEYYPSHN